jgi:hypothetical protein
VALPGHFEREPAASLKDGPSSKLPCFSVDAIHDLSVLISSEELPVHGPRTLVIKTRLPTEVLKVSADAFVVNMSAAATIAEMEIHDLMAETPDKLLLLCQNCESKAATTILIQSQTMINPRWPDQHSVPSVVTDYCIFDASSMGWVWARL